MAKEFKKYVMRDSSVLALTNELFISKNKNIEYDRTAAIIFILHIQQLYQWN